MKNSVRYFDLNFIKKEEISKDVSVLYFDRKNIDLNFSAGQYLHLYLPVENENGRGDSRMFTIASSPMEKDYIFIAVKKGRSLFKKTLFSLREGTSVKFYGPSGGLVLNDAASGGKKPSYVFLSLGIGITPFRSIIKYISQKNLMVPITLIASFSRKEDFLFLSELMEISSANPCINVIYSSNRINANLIKKNVVSINSHFYFIVGSPAGVADLEEVVSGMGVASDKVFIEDFEGY
ncbi:MAG: FAD-dependent oxidoreductase [Candidatus Levybacteria bacterium]|nr:FAD-dependent oxidoreductase [Candidatus Levybacteria bacterium]